MAVLVRARLDTDSCTTSAKMTEEIKLRKVGEPDFNSLPRGVYLIFVGDKPVFVRRGAGRFIPLPQAEQDRLREKHVVR